MRLHLLEKLLISSPKQKIRSKSSWNEFYPYYAGFPESFARDIIQTSELGEDSLIVDPWNGSGTTTHAASCLQKKSRGYDINPVMAIVAKARNISNDDLPEIEKILEEVNDSPKIKIASDDPLIEWMQIPTATTLRRIERNIFSHTTLDTELESINNMSFASAAAYVALFSVCRDLTKIFKSSNPTWLKPPKTEDQKVKAKPKDIFTGFAVHLKNILNSHSNSSYNFKTKPSILVSDSTTFKCERPIDLIITSPPYCTRLDYTAATRIELAVVWPLLNLTKDQLSKRMMGSIKVPEHKIMALDDWGPTCISFLEKLQAHPSKASTGYYLKTHLDYFDKLCRSISNISSQLSDTGTAVFVVQDSYYKEIHNDIPAILAEMAQAKSLELFRSVEFHQNNPLSGINSGSKKYRSEFRATESVLCFKTNKDRKK